MPAAKILKTKYPGVYYIEGKAATNGKTALEVAASGKPKLLEINPRFWGSLELAIRSGVDFPLLYAKAAMGEKLVPVHDYRAGVVCRWMFPGEILRYMGQGRGRRESFRTFLKGLPYTAEEWDNSDIRGFLSAFFCPLFSVLKPKYWGYLRR